MSHKTPLLFYVDRLSNSPMKYSENIDFSPKEFEFVRKKLYCTV